MNPPPVGRVAQVEVEADAERRLERAPRDRGRRPGRRTRPAPGPSTKPTSITRMSSGGSDTPPVIAARKAAPPPSPPVSARCSESTVTGPSDFSIGTTTSSPARAAEGDAVARRPAQVRIGVCPDRDRHQALHEPVALGGVDRDGDPAAVAARQRAGRDGHVGLGRGGEARARGAARRAPRAVRSRRRAAARAPPAGRPSTASSDAALRGLARRARRRPAAGVRRPRRWRRASP